MQQQLIENNSKTIIGIHYDDENGKNKKYRDRKYGMIYSILETVRSHGTISHSKIKFTSYGVGPAFKIRMKELFECGLLESVNKDHPNQQIRITEKGIKLLEIMEDILESYIPNSFLLWKTNNNNN